MSIKSVDHSNVAQTQQPPRQEEEERDVWQTVRRRPEARQTPALSIRVVNWNEAVPDRSAAGKKASFPLINLEDLRNYCSSNAGPTRTIEFNKAAVEELINYLNEQLKEDRKIPTSLLAVILDKLNKKGLFRVAKELFEAIPKFLVSKHINCFMIDTYGKSGRWKKAEELYNSLKPNQIDNFTQNAMIRAYGKAGLWQKAEELHRGIDERTEYIHNTMIEAYGKAGLVEQAEALYKHDCQFNNGITEGYMIKAYGKALRWKEARDRFNGLKFRETNNIMVINCLLVAYADSGRWQEAKELYKVMPTRDDYSHDALLLAHINASRFQEAEQILKGIKPETVRPYNTMIKGFGLAGEWKKALHLFNSIDPYLLNSQSYNLMIDILGRAKQLSLAEKLFNEMDAELKNLWTTHAMINGYGLSNQIQKARVLFQELAPEIQELYRGAKSEETTETSLNLFGANLTTAALLIERLVQEVPSLRCINIKFNKFSSITPLVSNEIEVQNGIRIASRQLLTGWRLTTPTSLQR